ncbi:MAG TPA: hypothetical protein VJ044_15710, partial [Candidatus Hodarchaeales archaeon]|nr:hypothetical protein [Candidatus Hodarchaeales archaeon]
MGNVSNAPKGLAIGSPRWEYDAIYFDSEFLTFPINSKIPRIAIVDSGINHSLESIKSNLWTNHGEIPGNLVDDDDNGYVDDVHGYDFINKVPLPHKGTGLSTHGTFIA